MTLEIMIFDLEVKKVGRGVVVYRTIMFLRFLFYEFTWRRFERMKFVTIENRVYGVLTREGYVDSRNQDEFYCDSLDTLRAFMEIEDAFGISIEDSGMEKIARDGNLLDSSTRSSISVAGICAYLASRSGDLH